MNDEQKQIEKMVKVIMDAVPETIQYVQAPANETEARIEAKALYAAGYRKQSETAREILKRITKEIEFFVKHNARVREDTDAEIARLTAKNADLQKRLENEVELSYSYLKMLKLLACASKCYANLNCNSTRGFDEIKNATDAFKDCLAKAEARLAGLKGGKE